MILYPEKIPLLEMDLIGWYWNSVEQYQPVLVDYFTLFCTRMEQYRKGYGGGGGSRTRNPWRTLLKSFNSLILLPLTTSFGHRV